MHAFVHSVNKATVFSIITIFAAGSISMYEQFYQIKYGAGGDDGRADSYAISNNNKILHIAIDHANQCGVWRHLQNANITLTAIFFFDFFDHSMLLLFDLKFTVNRSPGLSTRDADAHTNELS